MVVEGEGCYYSPWLRSVLRPLPWRPIELEKDLYFTSFPMLCNKGRSTDATVSTWFRLAVLGRFILFAQVQMTATTVMNIRFISYQDDDFFEWLMDRL